MDVTEKIIIKRFINNKMFELKDLVVCEEHFKLKINNNYVKDFVCTPKKIDYLVLGNLFVEGYISSYKDIKSIIIDEDRRIIEIFTTVTSNTSFNKKDYIIKYGFEIEADSIIENTKKFEEMSEIFLNTGGVHSAGLIEGNEIILFHDDIGRHNAVDKVIGEIIKNEIYIENKILITSCRISTEILKKAVVLRVPIVASVAAPTNKAVELADKYNITLIGMIRKNRINIYSGFKRTNT